MLNIEQIIEIAEANGAVVSKSYKDKGIGYKNDIGMFQEITVDELLINMEVYVFTTDRYECYAA